MVAGAGFALVAPISSGCTQHRSHSRELLLGVRQKLSVVAPLVEQDVSKSLQQISKQSRNNNSLTSSLPRSKQAPQKRTLSATVSGSRSSTLRSAPAPGLSEQLREQAIRSQALAKVRRMRFATFAQLALAALQRPRRTRCGFEQRHRERSPDSRVFVLKRVPKTQASTR